MERFRDKEMATYLRPAADRTVGQEEFYKFFNAWTLQTKTRSSTSFERVAKYYWGDLSARSIFFLIPRPAPKNILEQDRAKLRLSAKSPEEHWEVERTDCKVDEMLNNPSVGHFGIAAFER